MEIVKGHIVTETQEGAEPRFVFIKGNDRKAQKYIDDSLEMDVMSGETIVYTISNEIQFTPNRNKIIVNAI